MDDYENEAFKPQYLYLELHKPEEETFYKCGGWSSGTKEDRATESNDRGITIIEIL